MSWNNDYGTQNVIATVYLSPGTPSTRFCHELAWAYSYSIEQFRCHGGPGVCWHCQRAPSFEVKGVWMMLRREMTPGTWWIYICRMMKTRTRVFASNLWQIRFWWCEMGIHILDKSEHVFRHALQDLTRFIRQARIESESWSWRRWK